MAPSATADLSESSAIPAKLDFTTFRNIINGKRVDAQRHHAGINPATKEKLWPVPVATKEDLDDAVIAARAAFKKWKNTTREERNAILLKYADALEANKEEFSRLLTIEQGKPTFQADVEIGSCVAWLRAQTTITLEDEVLEDTAEKKVIVRYTPLGIVGGIIPWNFPAMLVIGKIAPATAAGNCIIIKTSPFTPYSGIKLIELANQFFPPGVVQCLSDEGTLGPLMTTHPDIDKISFTGSSATGKKVAAAASGTMKRVTLECGGNDPAIICASIKNIPAVAAEVATFALLNSGQICLAIKRIYVHASIYNEFRDAVVAHIKNLKVGGGLEPDTFLGPIQNDMQYEKVRGFLHDVKADGLKVAFGGQEIPTTASATGYYIHPTIVDNPPDTARIVTEEPFGPILPLLSWETEDEVVARANATNYGLGASIWSDNEEEAERIARQIESGTVWVNAHFDVSPLVPFGGHKESGMGVEWGASGLKAMCNSQTINMKKGKL